jgi:hypothetical protein
MITTNSGEHIMAEQDHNISRTQWAQIHHGYRHIISFTSEDTNQTSTRSKRKLKQLPDPKRATDLKRTCIPWRRPVILYSVTDQH